ncbi:hypothetical protein Y032_0034g2862 [Ancylostoma ceylanicum]|uniref:Uncharacterized protein n=1 Tax=Ancylostoma ceylanicum TaxID=53326 RepID=A0A016UNZ6_9BILA|nr:hypothetical protein Y032_0034g2862 [Ancylostoma ceylanicum]
MGLVFEGRVVNCCSLYVFIFLDIIFNLFAVCLSELMFFWFLITGTSSRKLNGVLFRRRHCCFQYSLSLLLSLRVVCSPCMRYSLTFVLILALFLCSRSPLPSHFPIISLVYVVIVHDLPVS